LIAHTVTATLLEVGGGNVVPVEPAQSMQAEMLLAPGSKGVVTRVNCPADGDVDVLIASAQDLQILDDGHCEVRL
jgi:hypothetical protein